MCFHSKQSKKAQELESRFKVPFKNESDKVLATSSSINGFDFPLTPVITNQEDCIQLFNWGLIPNWSKDDSIRQYTLNAKIETLDEKPSFKEHKTHRCLVIANGFYEWKWLNKSGSKKEKYLLHLAGDQLFAFAGVWSEWMNTSTGENIHSYSIVTTEAQGIMREVHNSKLRMPVILQANSEQDWLNGDDIQNYIDTKVDLLATSLSPNIQTSLF